jgi:hypothetical protein
MLNVKYNKLRFGGLVAIVCCLTVFGVWRADAAWQALPKMVAPDGEGADQFGFSVAIDGNYAIVGAPFDDGDAIMDSGSAYIFKFYGTNWAVLEKLTSVSLSHYFGYSVSISGGYAIVGAPGSDSAYIFRRILPETWIPRIAFTEADGFGGSVSISGDYAIVGAVNDDEEGENAGAAYIYESNDITWFQKAKLTASDAKPDNYFGCSVSVCGNYAIVGAYGADTEAGSAYVFRRTFRIIPPDTIVWFWTEQTKLEAPDRAAQDWFGSSVSTDGTYAVIAAPGDDEKGIDSGSVYVFKRDGLIWEYQTKLLASDGERDDSFGASVSVSGDYICIGARYGNSRIKDSGTAYIFKRDASNWVEQPKLLQSEGGAGNFFGNSVSISGFNIMVGAPHKGELAGPATGAAFPFGRLCPTADLSGDCFVDFTDLAMFVDQWLEGEE